jgi:DNA (cytosine-5)-methyltransferase 1
MIDASQPAMSKLTVAEFFCGGGGARAGLGPEWEYLFANDVSPAKAASYAANFGDEHLRVCDIAALTTDDIPARRVALCWASFPCQDLSLAGNRAGLAGERSSSFWPFMRLIEDLRGEGRAPSLIVIENVVGLLSSRGGQDFEAIRSALIDWGYRVGAVIIDAALFVPQSRERLFIIGVDAGVDIPARLLSHKPTAPFVSPPLALALDPLPDGRWEQPRSALRAPLWFALPVPPICNTTLADLLEEDDSAVVWDTAAKTAKMLAMMTEGNLAKIETAKHAGGRTVGGLYRRTRPTKDGGKVSRWEVRFDGLAGCLRVPTGSSSRQTVMIIEGGKETGQPVVRTRLLSPREAARLMGLPDDYVLPSNVNEALGLIGDGIAVPVVRFVAEAILDPILAANTYERGGRVDDHPVVTTTLAESGPPIDPWRLTRRRGQPRT